MGREGVLIERSGKKYATEDREEYVHHNPALKWFIVYLADQRQPTVVEEELDVYATDSAIARVLARKIIARDYDEGTIIKRGNGVILA